MTSGTPNSKRAAYGRKRERFGKITFDNKTNQSWSSCLSGLISLATPATFQPTPTSTTSTPFWGTLWKRTLFNGNVYHSNFPAKIEPTATTLKDNHSYLFWPSPVPSCFLFQTYQNKTSQSWTWDGWSRNKNQRFYHWIKKYLEIPNMKMSNLPLILATIKGRRRKGEMQYFLN